MDFINFDSQRYDKKLQHSNILRRRLHDIIFESETKAGKLFDIVLIVMIFVSILLLMLETVPELNTNWGQLFYTLEWVITVFFTIEYILRLYSAFKPLKYAVSFYGIVDFLSILPVYLGLLFPGTHSLMIVRSLRLMRIFRIFKLDVFLNHGYQIKKTLQESRAKIFVFLFFILLTVCVFGSLMYVIENKENPKFASIPESVYWAIVTVATVGYGDISPVTPLGKFVASIIIIIGYAVIAVPTGIITSSMVNLQRRNSSERCKNCGEEGHEADALYCKYCGYYLKD